MVSLSTETYMVSRCSTSGCRAECAVAGNPSSVVKSCWITRSCKSRRFGGGFREARGGAAPPVRWPAPKRARLGRRSRWWPGCRRRRTAGRRSDRPEDITAEASECLATITAAPVIQPIISAMNGTGNGQPVGRSTQQIRTSAQRHHPSRHRLRPPSPADAYLSVCRRTMRQIRAPPRRNEGSLRVALVW
jgi:hypothetical protein